VEQVVPLTLPHLAARDARLTRRKIYVNTKSFFSFAPIVQWIKQLRPKEKLYVRIVVGAPRKLYMLSEEEIQTVTAILSKLQPGLMPFDIFHQFARIAVLPIVEVVPLRLKDGHVEVLLVRRGADDPIWPSKLHTAGTVLRATDEADSFKTAFERIQTELGGTIISEPVFVMNSFNGLGRGREYSAIHWAECLEEPKVGAFYPVDALPADLVEGQRPFITAAAAAFAAARAR